MLPSSRRPKDLDELENGQFIKPIMSTEPRIPRLRINLPKTFLDMMMTWYTNMKKVDKGRLTPTKLKRRALFELSKLNYEYEALPQTWLTDLRKATGMKLYKRIKSDFKRDFEGIGPIDVKVGSDLLPMHLAVEGKSVRFTDTTFVPKTEPKEKKFLDLSSAPPPKEWIAAYLQGRHPPRTLLTCIHKGQMVCFYDYDPVLSAEVGQDRAEFAVHDRNDVPFLGIYSDSDDEDLYK